MIGTPAAVERKSQIERRLSAKLYDHAIRFFDIVDFNTSSSVSGSK